LKSKPMWPSTFGVLPHRFCALRIDGMRKEITRITCRQVREAAAEIETATGLVVYAFATVAIVQVFLHTHNALRQPSL